MERLQTTKFCIVGVGAIGRQLGMQLAAMGARHVSLIDFDYVEEHNISNQGYREDQISFPKVAALRESMEEINSDMEITYKCGKFSLGNYLDLHPGGADVVFPTVDKISTRSFIFDKVMNNTRLFCDGRMSAETMRILTYAYPYHPEGYPTTLFKDSETQGDECTARATIYTACIAAGIMLQQVNMWLRRSIWWPDILMNLQSMDVVLKSHPSPPDMVLEGSEVYESLHKEIDS